MITGVIVLKFGTMLFISWNGVCCPKKSNHYDQRYLRLKFFLNILESRFLREYLIYWHEIWTTYYTGWEQYCIKISSDYLHLFPRKRIFLGISSFSFPDDNRCKSQPIVLKCGTEISVLYLRFRFVAQKKSNHYDQRYLRLNFFLKYLAITIVTWRIFTTLLSRFGDWFLLWNPLYWQPEEESFTLAFRVSRILVLITYFFCYFSFSCERKLCDEQKSSTKYCFSASYFSVGPQHLSSHRRSLRHCHDPASNISWRSWPLAGTICWSYVLFLLPLRVNLFK